MKDVPHTKSTGGERPDVLSRTEESEDLFDYEYAIIRVVPRVHLCSFVNIGVLLHARTANYLDAIIGIDGESIAPLAPVLDVSLLERFTDAYLRVCRGGSDAGPVGVLPASGRFHWLTSPRSSVLQTSVVHPGRCRRPEEALAHLYEMYCERDRIAGIDVVMRRGDS